MSADELFTKRTRGKGSPGAAHVGCQAGGDDSLRVGGARDPMLVPITLDSQRRKEAK